MSKDTPRTDDAESANRTAWNVTPGCGDRISADLAFGGAYNFARKLERENRTTLTEMLNRLLTIHESNPEIDLSDMPRWMKCAGWVRCAACFGSGTVGDMNGIDKPQTCPDCVGYGYVANTDLSGAASASDRKTC